MAQDDTPTAEDITENWADDKLYYGVEGNGWIAVGGPEAEHEEDAIDADPWPFVIRGEGAPPVDKVEGLLEEEFNERCGRVYEKLDSVQDVLELDINPEGETVNDLSEIDEALDDV